MINSNGVVHAKRCVKWEDHCHLVERGKKIEYRYKRYKKKNITFNVLNAFLILVEKSKDCYSGDLLMLLSGSFSTKRREN